MPVTFYTQDEYDAVINKSYGVAMALSQALCDATGYDCIRGPDNKSSGLGEYCDDCPAQQYCPYQFKKWSQ